MRNTKKMGFLLKTAAICAAALLMVPVAGCQKAGTEQPQTESSSELQGGNTSAETTTRVLMKNLKLEDYITVGDYRSIRVAKEDLEVTEEEVNSTMWTQYLYYFPAEKGVMDRGVEIGDTANIDYEGKIDGVAFSGGTAQGHNLAIGSHSFIDGFEDGLVGVMPGDTVDLNLRFPDSYRNPDLSGKDAVFTVKVNYIIPAEYMEEAIPAMGFEGITTVAQFRQLINDSLVAQKTETIEKNYENTIFSTFIGLCEFKDMPQVLLSSTKETIRESMTSTAALYGLDVDTYVGYVYGTDLETFLAYYSLPSLQQNMALYYVAKQENLIPEGEDLEAAILEYASDYGLDDADSYLQAIGATKDEFQEDYSITKAYNRVLEIAAQ